MTISGRNVRGSIDDDPGSVMATSRRLRQRQDEN
jgi:hypothetical protein